MTPMARIVTATATALVLVVTACGGGDEGTPLPTVSTISGASDMQLTSSAFGEGDSIPARYTCDGEEVSPPLSLGGAPDHTRSLVVLLEDPDAPGGVFDHWVLYGIDPSTSEIPEGESVGTSGRNSSGDLGYGGPCPPGGTHRYVFRLLALDVVPDLPLGASKDEVLDASKGHVLAEARLEGRYGR